MANQGAWRRNLLYFRELNLAVVLGVAVAGATLTGALMVGDSVRGSLRQITYERLGTIQFAVAPQHLVGPELAEALRASELVRQAQGTVAEAIMLSGAARTEQARAAKVAIQGVDAHFEQLFDDGSAKGLTQFLAQKPGQNFPAAVVNQRLAEELRVKAGDELIVSFPKDSAIHRDSLYGRKQTEDVIQQMRLTVTAVLADSGVGRFALAPSQQVPFEVFLNLDALRRALGKSSGANTLLLGSKAQNMTQEAVAAELSRHAELADFNLNLRIGQDVLALETPSFFFPDRIAEAVLKTAKDQGLAILPTSTYLANSLRAGAKEVPYSLICGLDISGALAHAQLTGKPPGQGDEVVVNRWTADDLGLAIGDTLELSYYEVGAAEELHERSIELVVTGVLEMQGLGVDRDLTPIFPGAEGAENLSEWDPTFPMEMSRIRPQDETYWDDYYTAPKAFVSEALARRLWGGRFGFYTGFRLAPPEGVPLAQAAERLSASLAAGIDLGAAGLAPLPLMASGLEASTGATDFTGLFIGLSFFIILSACLLIGLFFRLLVLGRVGEVGMLQAMGYSFSAVRGQFLREGLALSALGGGFGALGGVLYAVVLLFGLRNFWDLGTRQLHFHLNPLSLVMGFAITVIVAWLSIYLSVRVLRKFSLVALIRRLTELNPAQASARWRRVFQVALLAAVTCGVATVLQPTHPAYGFATGLCLFVLALSALAQAMARPRKANGLGGDWVMALRNTARQSGRSLVCVVLVAVAVYTLVAVGLFRNSGAVDVDDPHSGTGGFFLAAEAEVPLHAPLESAARRADLGLDEAQEQVLEQAQVVSLRLQPGDDASCLNLFAPRQPRLLGLPQPAALKDRFSFQQSLAPAGQDPWSLLDAEPVDGAIPVIGDFNSVIWILKSGLDKTIEIRDGAGKPVKLRFVGLLQGSIFQSELIVAERQFQKIFPEASGYGSFLFASQDPKRDALLGLETALTPYGFDISGTGERIEAFHAIENTYISIFQMLGGLGLLLGTLGLGAIIYRNAAERRGELAALRAFGYDTERLAGLMIRENSLLVVWGILTGALSAVVSMLPNLISTQVTTSWLLLIGTLVAVLITGLVATVWAVRRASRFPLLEALRTG